MTTAPQTTTDPAVVVPTHAHASAFNVGLSICESASINAEAMSKAIAYTSDFLSLLTEVQSTIDDANNAGLQDQIDLINGTANASTIQQYTTEYNLMSSQASAFDQQSTSQETTFNSFNSNRADSVNSYNSTIASILSGLSSLSSLLAK